MANANFTIPAKEVIPIDPFWQPYANLETAKSAGQYLISFMVILYLFFKFLKPMLKRLSDPQVSPPVQPIENNTSETIKATDGASAKQPNEELNMAETNIEAATKLAIEDPRMVANIVKKWINE